MIDNIEHGISGLKYSVVNRHIRIYPFNSIFVRYRRPVAVSDGRVKPARSRKRPQLILFIVSRPAPGGG
ncbi:hypothetical protein EVAR_8345_1 [Eumeta japonica]|uniref:Uncharacterized protein n=1 Tax=Eumeta variegata TaxID=151549 RepID=A0A4C1VDZ0_EUMVA|nr:hypothetical protein EVAR_8345_1 [Eumeta japonica]